MDDCDHNKAKWKAANRSISKDNGIANNLKSAKHFSKNVREPMWHLSSIVRVFTVHFKKDITISNQYKYMKTDQSRKD